MNSRAMSSRDSEPRTTLTIEARDLDTDARRRTTLEAALPADPTRRRGAVVEAVEHLFPGATLRSSADGAATFLDAKHLIVASYADSDSAGGEQSPEFGSEERQEALFAA
jgi:hypothetical protein